MKAILLVHFTFWRLTRHLAAGIGIIDSCLLIDVLRMDLIQVIPKTPLNISIILNVLQ